MSIFAEPTVARTPRSKQSSQMAVLYAGFITLMLVAQLFTFDEFLILLGTFAFPFTIATAYIIGALLVTVELFALPFLLRMTVSHAFRWVSMVCAWFVSGLWLFLSVWAVTRVPSVESIGFLGSLPLTPGWWAVMVSLSFIILATWSSWGLWPGRRTDTK